MNQLSSRKSGTGWRTSLTCYTDVDMLKPQALANSFAGTTIILYIVLFILKIIAFPFFQLIINSQFFGINIADEVPTMNLANFLGVLIAVGLIAWLVGYLIATIYNRLIT